MHPDVAEMQVRPCDHHVTHNHGLKQHRTTDDHDESAYENAKRTARRKKEKETQGNQQWRKERAEKQQRRRNQDEIAEERMRQSCPV